MTNKQAYKAALRPYLLSNDTIELILTQYGFDMDEDFEVEQTQTFYEAVIEGLITLITLEEEKDAGSTNKYDTDKIQQRINYYRRKYDIEDPDEELKCFIDRTFER